MIKVDLRMSEFFYSQRPEELAEYRRLKVLEETRTDNENAEMLAAEIANKTAFQQKKRGRKRKKKRKGLGERLKGGISRRKKRGNHK